MEGVGYFFPFLFGGLLAGLLFTCSVYSDVCDMTPVFREDSPFLARINTSELFVDCPLFSLVWTFR
jgi:hypothetical protein